MKQVLYIGGKYISTIAELKDLLQNGRVQLIKDEIVAAQKDGTLSEWILSQNLELWEKELKTREKQFADNDTASEDTERVTREEVKNIKDKIDEIRDEFTNDICKSVYKVITGEHLSIDLSSDFSQIASLISCDIEGCKYQNNNGNINIVGAVVKEESKMVFHFESLKDNSDELVFALKQDNYKLAEKSRTRKNYKVGEMFSIEFDIQMFNTFSSLILEDGKGNRICKIHISKNCKIHISKNNIEVYFSIDSEVGPKEVKKTFKAMPNYPGYFFALIDLQFYKKNVDTSCSKIYEDKAESMIKKLNKLVSKTPHKMELATLEQLQAALPLIQVKEDTKFLVRNKNTTQTQRYQNGKLDDKNHRPITGNIYADYIPVVVKTNC